MANSKHEVTIKVQGDSSDKVQPSQAQSPKPTNTQSDMSKEMHSRAKQLVDESRDESGKPSMTYHEALSQSGKSVHQEFLEARQGPSKIDHDEFTRVGIGGNKLVEPETPEEIESEAQLEPVQIEPEQLMPSLADMGKMWAVVFETISDFGGKIKEEHLARAVEMTKDFYNDMPAGTQTGFAEDLSSSVPSPEMSSGTSDKDDDNILDVEVVDDDENVISEGIINSAEARQQDPDVIGSGVGEDETGLSTLAEDVGGDLIEDAAGDMAADMGGVHNPEISSKFDTDSMGHVKAMGKASIAAAGSTAGASSAGDALSFFGGMARAGAGLARDQYAGTLGKASKAAKIGVGIATKGAVQPTSSEEEGLGGGGGSGGGGMMGGLLGGGGGDGGGGGGNPINAMAGDMIDEVFSAPLKGVDMFIEVMEKGFEVFMQLNAAVEEAYNEIMGFSGAMIEARVNTELELMEKRMGRAGRMGEQFADYEDSRRELLTSFEDTKEILMRIIVPIVTFIMNIITVIAKFINMILALIMVIIEAIYFVIEALLDMLMIPELLEGIGGMFDWVTSWLLGSDDEQVDPLWDNLAQWVGDPRGALGVMDGGPNIWGDAAP
tara:strand:- start:4752 stop:6569 length:1818 start_codon:yes stop_codon:yes gene_type:complete